MKEVIKIESVQSGNPFKSQPPRLSTVVGLTSMIQTIKDKIFQPLFPNKPTRQGTGLGLSLSYDIITKGHDGHLKVETKESIGSEFIIILPVKI